MFGTIVAIFFTLAIFSFLYKDNPVYKFAEHFFVGIASGYFIVIQYHNVFIPNLISPLYSEGIKPLWSPEAVKLWSLFLVFPFGMGLLMFAKFSRDITWLARWPMAVVVGSFSGLQIIGYAQGDLVPQIHANMLPIVKAGAVTTFLENPGLFTLLDVLWNPILIVGVTCTLIYFFFSVPHKNVIGGAATLGIWFLMISFGASYGNTVMTRISLLIERFDFLVAHWELTLAILPCVVAGIILLSFRKQTAA
ncbi:hypothetical protein ACFL27_04765 [candidate division CSSED10-310 bacterium]|uniref:Prolipoprotein diacylglyceryl transferase n=1 Tax=candidate division CSSED10-310 bacterium TaxID=2855610 RepID=A0ABV6YTG6_UNCC1